MRRVALWKYGTLRHRRQAFPVGVINHTPRLTSKAVRPMYPNRTVLPLYSDTSPTSSGHDPRYRTMPVINVPTDSDISDFERRRYLFAGNLFLYGPRSASVAVRDAARRILEQWLGDEPHLTQQRVSEPEFAALFAAAARNFAQRTDVLEEICELISDLGCDARTTFVGRRSLIANTGQGFLPYGLGAPRHPHRDTWWGASPCQVSWWIPLYDLATSASLAFHPLYWDAPIVNNSAGFDLEAVRHGPPDEVEPSVEEFLTQPRALEEIVLSPDIRIACSAGSVIVSSVAQLHSMVPNPSLGTRFFAHFQTVDRADLISGAGASNLDAEAAGTLLRDFERCDDSSPIPSELVEDELEWRRRSRRGQAPTDHGASNWRSMREADLRSIRGSTGGACRTLPSLG